VYLDYLPELEKLMKTGIPDNKQNMDSVIDKIPDIKK